MYSTQLKALVRLRDPAYLLSSSNLILTIDSLVLVPLAPDYIHFTTGTEVSKAFIALLSFHEFLEFGMPPPGICTSTSLLEDKYSLSRMPSITYDMTPTTNQVNVQVPRYLHGQCLCTIYIFTKQRYSGARLIVYTHIRSQIMMVQVLGKS